MRSVFGNAQLQDIARHLGLPVDAALNMLSEDPRGRPGEQEWTAAVEQLIVTIAK